MYVNPSNRTNRFSTYQPSILQWTWEADQIYRNSAIETGGTRRIRFVHDATCAPAIVSVTLSPAADDNLQNTMNELSALGYNRSDRKYMIFMDANVVCGIGTVAVDARPGQENWNNTGPDYGRTDAGCWSGHVVAHEHMHNLGAVQDSAPHASGGLHCLDDYDVMCYKDAETASLQIACADPARDTTRFDCNYDDYFNTNPPSASALTKSWNTANNRFLATGSTEPPVACPDTGSEPDDNPSVSRTLTAGNSAERAFCVAGDQDWFDFPAVTSRSYRIEILTSEPSTAPVLDLYAPNGSKLLMASYPSGGALARIDFRARTTGNHFLRVGNNPAQTTSGIDKTYRVGIAAQPAGGSAVGGWGFNAFGQAGGVGETKTLPSLAFNNPGLQVSGGFMHSLALLDDGTVRSWGWNAVAQLGDGTLADRATPVAVQGLNGVVSVSAGLLHNLALKEDGTVWAWGYNAQGQLGDGTTANKVLPVQVQGLTEVVEVSAGALHNLALKRDGSIWAWGYNALGQLGDGSTRDQSRPIRVPGTGVSVAAGGHHSMAVTPTGTVKAWGWNAFGQLGDGSRTDRLSPVSVAISNVYRLSAGYIHSVGLKDDGSVAAWGYNALFGAGAASRADRPLPGPVTCSGNAACPRLPGSQTLGRIAWISAGGLHTVALSEDGKVWAWGYNAQAQLGDGTLTDSALAVPAASQATDASAGFLHTLFRSN